MPGSSWDTNENGATTVFWSRPLTPIRGFPRLARDTFSRNLGCDENQIFKKFTILCSFFLIYCTAEKNMYELKLCKTGFQRQQMSTPVADSEKNFGGGRAHTKFFFGVGAAQFLPFFVLRKKFRGGGGRPPPLWIRHWSTLKQDKKTFKPDVSFHKFVNNKSKRFLICSRFWATAMRVNTMSFITEHNSSFL